MLAVLDLHPVPLTCRTDREVAVLRPQPRVDRALYLRGQSVREEVLIAKRRCTRGLNHDKIDTSSLMALVARVGDLLESSFELRIASVAYCLAKI